MGRRIEGETNMLFKKLKECLFNPFHLTPITKINVV
jgi:hypothetical protein